MLVIGQDPAQHEIVVRRILAGEAGRRVQGLLAKLGITRSYVFINTYLYSVYGSVKAKTRRAPALVDYRNRWLKALLAGNQIEAVLALGKAADEAWQFWKVTPEAQAVNVGYAAITHPTGRKARPRGTRPGSQRKQRNSFKAGMPPCKSLHLRFNTPMYRRRLCSITIHGLMVIGLQFQLSISRRDCLGGCMSRTDGPGARALTNSLKDVTSPLLSRKESSRD